MKKGQSSTLSEDSKAVIRSMYALQCRLQKSFLS